MDFSEEAEAFVSQTALRKGSLELRPYQLSAAKAILEKGNSLLVMPTALGKTFVAALVVATFLKRAPLKKILFLTPTKPLALQQARRLQEMLDVASEEVVVVTGEVAPEERASAYAKGRIFCGTPQAIENDLLTRRFSLVDFSLVIVDEAHRTVGNYSYVFISQNAIREGARLLGLTASPSSDEAKLREIMNNLGIEHLEVKSELDDDVIEYAKPIKVEWEQVSLPPEFVAVKKELEAIFSDTLRELKVMGAIESIDLRKTNKRTLLELRTRLLQAAQKNPAFYRAISLQAKALNLEHALDLLESQGVSALLAFFKGMKERKTASKAVKELLNDFRLKKAEMACEKLISEKIDHPKLAKLKSIVEDEVSSGKSLIVFSHFRSTAEKLERELSELRGVKACKLVGRANKGMSQKQQAEVLDRFRAKEFNVLVATQVAEEGIDVPAVDLVVFYEPVPSEIRFIQRRGRTGRVRSGKAIVLIARDTKDEAFFWAARRKERMMKEHLQQLRGKPIQPIESKTADDVFDGGEGESAEEELDSGQKQLDDF